jgi:exosortase
MNTVVTRSPLGARELVWIALPALLLFALFFPTLRDTAFICWEDEDYSHGLLLPFIAIYFVYTNWDRIGPKFFDPTVRAGFSLSGLLLLAAGMTIFLLGEIANLLYIRWFAFFPAAAGMLFLVFSPARAAPFIGPLLLNFMAKPLPDSLVPKLFFPLQVMAAKVSARMLELLNVPVYLKGNIIEIPGMQLMVEEACSGLRSLMALLTVAFIVLYSIELPFIAKVVLVTSSVFIAIALNVVRVAATGVLAHFYDPKAATGFFHTFSGLVVFVIGLVVLFSFGVLLKRIADRRAS